MTKDKMAKMGCTQRKMKAKQQNRKQQNLNK
jgi:hypothetical protein